MVREIANETEADGGHRQRINDFITGLERTAAFVHELARAALKSKHRRRDTMSESRQKKKLLKVRCRNNTGCQ